MKPSNEQLIKGLPRRILLMLLDCALIVLCFYLSIVLRYDDAATLAAQNIIDTPSREAVITAMTPMLIYILPIYMVVFWFGGLYEIMWEYAGMRDLAQLTLLAGLATGIVMFSDLMLRGVLYRTVLVMGAVFIVLLVGGVRFLWRGVKSLAAQARSSAPPCARRQSK